MKPYGLILCTPTSWAQLSCAFYAALVLPKSSPSSLYTCMAAIVWYETFPRCSILCQSASIHDGHAPRLQIPLAEIKTTSEFLLGVAASCQHSLPSSVHRTLSSIVLNHVFCCFCFLQHSFLETLDWPTNWLTSYYVRSQVTNYLTNMSGANSNALTSLSTKRMSSSAFLSALSCIS